ncbi:signaling protein, partial [Brevibacterium paucivorans]
MARHSDQPRRRISAFAVSSFLAFVLVLVTVVLPVPYMVETPGPVFNTLGKVKDTDKDVVEITGAKTYPTDGQLNMLTVGVVGGPDRHMSA